MKSDDFNGAAGELPNDNNWELVTNVKVNNELQDYTTSNRNLQRSGGNTLQIVPWYEGNRWTSGRVESKYEFTPTSGSVTMVEASIRFGDNPTVNKRGYWPAFWLLGAAIRNGVDWPRCGEIDILETVNGQLEGFGTVHCDIYPGAPATNPWAQTITWYRDEQQFHQISGAAIASEGIWKTLAQAPLFFILNVAVGGNLPGDPDSNTRDGYGSMMEVGYVAHYVQS
ncbi:unnamed protein product [Parascedosporium putredinis]|uniref:GH16 domain-containing protein n=1 Tax=Parascedosporium putredinis TaxID=1442378 RepID=A0A9P1MA70_9PEZI|nr:unnamed protein product [Parascedosporium putredinis]CAI7996094.1 unnamed protein product [Parascedosporium putredinis]